LVWVGVGWLGGGLGGIETGRCCLVVVVGSRECGGECSSRSLGGD